MVRSSLFALGSVASGAVVRYDGHQVVRCLPVSEEQVKVLHDLDDSEKFDFWTEARATGKPVDIRCGPSECDELQAFVAKESIQCSTLVEDVQKAADDMLPKGLQSSASFALDEYHTYDDIIAWMKQLADQYSDIAEYIEVGTSYQGRKLAAIKITGSKSKSGKKAFWMDGGIHAREWITTASMNYMLAKTLEQYGSDDTVTSLVDNLNVYYAPVINPDGYSYTWTNDRMQRKTMMPSGCTRRSSPGTDPNRNWDFHWNEAGSSTDPCSESYAGASAADQPEVQAVQDFIREKDDFLGYINFHSYSQLWMAPWGYTSSKSPDYDVQNAAAKAAVTALEAVHGTQYEYGPISTTIYPASGSSADYTYGVCGVLFSYGVELRDTGLHGFVLPADQIVPTGEETFEGIKALGQYMIAHDSGVVV